MATDDFLRANESPLAGNWSRPTGWTGTLELLTNEVTTLSAADQMYRYTPITPGSSQFSQAKISVTGTDAEAGPGVTVYIASGAQTGYSAIVNKAGTNNVSIIKWSSATYNLLTQRTTTWVNGDVLKLSVEPSGADRRLKVFKNGIQLGADFVDATSPITSGDVGIGFSSGAGISGVVIDDWEGADLASAATLMGAICM